MIFSQILKSTIPHASSGGYLVNPYLSITYDAATTSAGLRSQVTKILQRTIRSQILLALYNITRIRILASFPSRGTTGLNWSYISGASAAGSFSINNLNTDLVEQVVRTTSTSVTMQNDTQVTQGIYMDTMAILNHNLTLSAVVTVIASNDPGFSTVLYSFIMPNELENMYYIAPTIPLLSARYFRFVISDTSNPDGYISMGTIVFGSSVIFSGECVVDQVTKKKVHFKDGIKTEGFTTVSNDRALKTSVSFSFKYLDFNKNNYKSLTTIINLVRTSLKALWIIDPRFPSRFAPFGKLTEIPIESHLVIGKDADYIDMDLTVDESL